MPDRFTSRAGIALAGVTARPHWRDERGVVTSEPEGRRRLYTNQHLNEVEKPDKCPAEIVDRSSPYHLLIAGTHLYLESSAKPIMDIRRNSNQPILGSCHTDAVRQFRAGIASGKANTSVTSLDHRRRARKAS
jgi:hypothetical protein